MSAKHSGYCGGKIPGDVEELHGVMSVCGTADFDMQKSGHGMVIAYRQCPVIELSSKILVKRTFQP